MIRTSAVSIALLFLLLPVAGCIGQDDVESSDDIQETDNEVTVDEDPVVEIIDVPYAPGCDNLNPHHCLLPFPSDAFLVEDETTRTGLRVHYPTGSIPSSGSTNPVEIPRINQIDGMSTSTQIMTTFDTVPNLDGVAYQYDIGTSMQPDHATIIWNADDNHAVAHWVELDARAQDGEQTIVHLRTASALEHDTKYIVVIRGLSDQQGDLIEPSAAMRSLIGNTITDAADVEDRRLECQKLS